jgi:ferredoxin
VVSIKIDHEKCSMCEDCLNEEGEFCPKNLFYRGKVKDKENNEIDGIKFKFKEISKCQGCLRCAALCPEKALKPATFEA